MHIHTHTHAHTHTHTRTHAHTHTGMLTNETESLFTYLPYQSFASFQDSNFVPIFDPDYSTVPVPDHLTVCVGDSSCLYDVTVTGSVEIASSTHAAVTEITQTEQLSAPGNDNIKYYIVPAML